MCGISGYYCFGNVYPNKETIEELFVNIMERGSDASGIAYIHTPSKSLKVYKSKKPSIALIQEKGWKSLKLAHIPIMIMHTRAATKGSEENNMNNHPIYSKSGVAIVHNGVITNDDYLFTKFKFARDAQVDSEIILRLIEDNWWEDVKNDRLNELYGSFAIASINSKEPKKLILARHTNPIHIYMDVQNDILYFASTKSILEDTFASYCRGFKVKSIETISLDEDKAYLIDENGVNTIHPLDIKYKQEYFSNHKNFNNNTNQSIKDFRKSNQEVVKYFNSQEYINDRKAKELNDAKEKKAYKKTELGVLGTVFSKCDECNKYEREIDMYKIGKESYCENCMIAFSENRVFTCPWCTEVLDHFEIINKTCRTCFNTFAEPVMDDAYTKTFKDYNKGENLCQIM